MKTILEWYEELPEPYRSQAIENANAKDSLAESLSTAISSGFFWPETPEGFSYWDAVHVRITEGEPLTPTLEQTLTEAMKSLNELKTALEEVRKAIGNESN